MLSPWDLHEADRAGGRVGGRAELRIRASDGAGRRDGPGRMTGREGVLLAPVGAEHLPVIDALVQQKARPSAGHEVLHGRLDSRRGEGGREHPAARKGEARPAAGEPGQGHEPAQGEERNLVRDLRQATDRLHGGGVLAGADRFGDRDIGLLHVGQRRTIVCHLRHASPQAVGNGRSRRSIPPGISLRR